eukprot:gb/GEZN01003190.1/.p1 GENE.gb/GEZN01003190.1/~~gb/GEZN01003190.1/.p1  ORF type:complete len:591 (+),score=74.97 gb/GEZN01003190.1/:181-1773(+)
MNRILLEVPLVAVPGLGDRVRNFSRKFSRSSLSQRGSSIFLDDNEETEPLLDKIDAAKYTAPLLAAVSCAVIGSFQNGLNSVILNVPETQVKASLHLDDVQWSIVVSSFCIGGLMGSYFAGPISDSVGRKTFLTLNNGFFILAALLQGFAFDFYMLAIGRLIIGIGSGCITAVVPLYLGEIAPAALRGSLGTLNQLALVTGILVSNILGKPFGHESGFFCWRGLVGAVAMLPAILSLFLAPLLLESPRWLLLKDKGKEATQVLCKLRGLDEAADAAVYALDLEALHRSKVGKGEGQMQSACSLLLGRYRFPLFIAVSLQIAQQMSGINAVFFYSTSFLKAANVSDPWLGTVLVGGVNVLGTCAAVVMMDKLGRRTLLLVSSFGMLISCLGITVALYFINIQPSAFLGSALVGFLLIYVTAFELGLGPIPWLMVAEILPSHVGGLGMSVASSVNWLANFTVSLAFPIVRERLGIMSFAPFAVVLLLHVFFVAEYVPETRGKSLGRIQAELTMSPSAQLGAYDDESEDEEAW